MRVTFNEDNLSIIGEFVEHNRKIFGAVQHSIIGKFLSIIGSALPVGLIVQIIAVLLVCNHVATTGLYMKVTCIATFEGRNI